jgi:osmoprotectant transport system substrate-binding protein
MKKYLFTMLFLFILSPQAQACVGKILNIGVVNTSGGQVLAEMLSSLINERTGSTVAIRFYNSEQDLSAAMNVKQVDISVENTALALQFLHKPSESNVDKAYELVKAAYEKERGLVWLKPFGFMHSSGAEAPSYTAAVLRIEVLNNFPALPRVIGKLGNILNDETYGKLIKSVESGEKPRKAARDFLKSKKLI